MANGPGDDLLLYDHPGSPCARRVRISLIEKGLRWQTQTIDLSKLEQRSRKYLAINPNGVVPALAHGSRIVWESNVITEYLDRVFPDQPLYPAGAAERLAVKEWQVAELAMAKDFRPIMYQRLMGPIVHATRSYAEAMDTVRRSTDDPADLEWEDKVWRVAVLTPDEQLAVEAKLYAFADRVEAALRATGWLAGDRFSQAEISIYPRLSMYPWIGLPITADRFPNIADWFARLARRASFVESESKDTRDLAGFLQSPFFAFLRRATKRPPAERPLFDRIGVKLVGAMIRRGERAAAASIPPGWREAGSALPDLAAAAPRPAASIALDAPVTLASPRPSPDGALIGLALRQRGIAFDEREAESAFHLDFAGRPIDDLLLALDAIDLAAAPGPRLFPEDPADEAQVRIWLSFGQSWHKEYNPLMAVRVLGRKAVRSDLSLDSAARVLEGRLDQLEARLRGRSWVATNACTVADVALHGKVSILPRMGIDPLDHRPNLAAWLERCGEPLTIPTSDHEERSQCHPIR